MLDLKRLRVFQEVARSGSFSAAAVRLNYSQPAVSHHIARLELEVGARLVERGPRGATRLTAAGAVLLDEADRLLAAMADAQRRLAEAIETGQHRVRLAAFDTASATFVADAVGWLRRTHPELDITLVDADPAAVLEALRASQIDIGLVFDDERHPLCVEDGLVLRPLFEDPMWIALPTRHPLARHAQVDLASLRNEPWIEGAGTTTPSSLILASVCHDAGFTPRIAFNSGNYQVVLRLVAAEVGVALVPGLASAVPNGVVLRPAKGRQPVRRIALVRRANAMRTASIRTVCRALETASEAWAAAVTERGAVA